MCPQNCIEKQTSKRSNRCTILFDVYYNKGSNLNVKGYNCHKLLFPNNVQYFPRPSHTDKNTYMLSKYRSGCNAMNISELN